MKNSFYNEETLRKFLLGDVSDDMRDAIEDRFLADEEFSSQVLIVEDELIESYLRDELSAHERGLFESAFLTTSTRRERVLVMKGIISAANAEASTITSLEVKEEKTSLRNSVLAFLRFENSFARYSLVAASLLVVLISAWFLVGRLNQNKNERVANTNTTQPPDKKDVVQTPVPDISPAPKSDSLPETLPSPKAQPKTKPRQIQKTEPTFATIVLRPVLLRDPNKSAKLMLSQSVKQVRLQLNLERNDYKSYIVRITNVEGNSVWQGGPLYVRGTSGNTITINLPAKILPTDDYIIELSGVSDAGPIESFADYFFSVTHK